jgi:hypothetical protein
VTHSLMTCFRKMHLFYTSEAQGEIIASEIFCIRNYSISDTGEIYILAYNLFFP